jgi:hypothetical protein
MAASIKAMTKKFFFFFMSLGFYFSAGFFALEKKMLPIAV